MIKKEGIPKEVIEEIKLKEPKKEKYEAKIVVEKHQVKIPIPSGLREELDLRKGDLCILELIEKDKLLCEIKRK